MGTGTLPGPALSQAAGCSLGHLDPKTLVGREQGIRCLPVTDPLLKASTP